MVINEIEQARVTYLSKLRRCWVIAWLLIVLIMLYLEGPAFLAMVTDFDPKIDPLFIIINLILVIFLVGAASIAVHSIARKEASAYQKAYKAYFVATTLARHFENLSYNHESGLSEYVILSTKMISTCDRYTSNDLTTGVYKGNSFMQADVKIEEEHEDSDGNSTYVTVFKGRWMIFDFPRKFDFRLLVRGRRCGSIVSLEKTSPRKFEKIETESTTFNKMFKIYAEDGFEAFYLLQPDFIHDLESLGAEVKGRLILCFADNKLHIGINNGSDSFEPPRPNRPIDEATEHAKIETEIKLITDFVDRLELSPKLFTTGA